MDTTGIVYISAEVVVAVLSIVGNTVVLAAIVKTRRLHTVTNVFIGNLATADIVVGYLVAPCSALTFIGVGIDFYSCVLINSLILTFTNVSILMLLAVAVERFLAIKEPFAYQRLLTVKRAIYLNVFVWFLGIALGLVPMYGWNTGNYNLQNCNFVAAITMDYMVYFQFFGLVLVPLFFMLCIYAYILHIVRGHMRHTNALQKLFRNEQQTRDTFQKDVRAAKLFALVILLFAICWLPVNILNTLTLLCSSCSSPPELLLAAIVMSHANSSINPFLYAASNSRIKNAIKSLFGVQTSPDNSSNTDLHRHAPHNTNNVAHSSGDLNNICENDHRKEENGALPMEAFASNKSGDAQVNSSLPQTGPETNETNLTSVVEIDIRPHAGGTSLENGVIPPATDERPRTTVASIPDTPDITPAQILNSGNASESTKSLNYAPYINSHSEWLASSHSSMAESNAEGPNFTPKTSPRHSGMQGRSGNPISDTGRVNQAFEANEINLTKAVNNTEDCVQFPAVPAGRSSPKGNIVGPSSPVIHVITNGWCHAEATIDDQQAAGHSDQTWGIVRRPQTEHKTIRPNSDPETDAEVYLEDNPLDVTTSKTQEISLRLEDSSPGAPTKGKSLSRTPWSHNPPSPNAVMNRFGIRRNTMTEHTKL